MPIPSIHTFSGNYVNGFITGFLNFTVNFYYLGTTTDTETFNSTIFPYKLIMNGTTIIQNDSNAFSQVGNTETSTTTVYTDFTQQFPNNLLLDYQSSCLGSTAEMTIVTQTFKFNQLLNFYNSENFQTELYITFDENNLNVGPCVKLAKIYVTAWIDEIPPASTAGQCFQLATPTYDNGRLIGTSEYIAKKQNNITTTSNASTTPPCAVASGN